MGIFATSFIMPVSAEETSTSSNDTITVFEKDLSTGENTTNEIQIADNDNIKQMLIFLKQIKMISKLIIILSVHIILLVTMTESLLNHRIRGLLYLKALLKIHYPDGRVLNGTAWIFAKRALMTAGHCIHNNSYGGTATKLPVALSIDEFKGDTNCENYQCILTDPVNKVVLDILPKRYESYLTKYFNAFSREERSNVKYFVSDMWKPYSNISSVWFKNATQIVDKYHWIRQVIWAFEAVRKQEQKKFSKSHRRYFKKSRQLLIKRFNFLSDEQKQQVNIMLRPPKSLCKSE